MTPETLENLVRDGPTDELVAQLTPLTDAERKKLSKTVIALQKRDRESRLPGLPRVPRALLRMLPGGSNEEFTVRTDLAALALCPWTQARQVTSHGFPFPSRHISEWMYAVLAARKPDWLERWVGKELEDRRRGRHFTFVDWSLIRRLVREGLCPRPEGEAYIVKMVHTHFDSDHRTPLVDKLRSDPGLLQDEVWRIFEVNPVGDTFLSDFDATAQDDCSWASALVELAAEGKLSRARLLKASLQALAQGLQPKNTGWFWKFHERLKPTIDERAALQDVYIRLLSCDVAPVVGFALDALMEVARHERLDESQLIESIVPSFRLRPKSQPMKAVRLLQRASVSAPDLRARIAHQAAFALSHEQRDVHETALALIESCVSGPDPKLAKTLSEYGDSASVSLRARIAELQARLRPSESNAEAQLPAATADGLDWFDDSRGEIQDIPPLLRDMAGIDSLLEAVAHSAPVPPVTFDPMRVRRCRPESAVVPIQDVEELIEGFSAAIEDLQDPMELERLLDGASRLCDQFSDDLQSRVEPLWHRTGQLPASATYGSWFRTCLIAFVRSWLNHYLAIRAYSETALQCFLDNRMQELLVHVRRRRAVPLLALPTHRGGWIEPLALVERLYRRQQDEIKGPDHHDFIQALLRLAPDGREEALNAAQKLTGPHGAGLRLALGADELASGVNKSILLAAWRTRTPRGDIPSPYACLVGSGPDAALAAKYDFELKEVEQDFRHRPDDQPTAIFVHALPDAEESALRNEPTVSLHDVPRRDLLEAFEPRWIATVWPHQLDPLFARGAAAISCRLSKPASPFFGHSAFLEPLLDPDTPFSEMAQLLLAVALVSRDADASGLAVDSLIQLIWDGRCTGKETGEVYTRLIAGGLVKANRLAKSLAVVARESALHAHVCAQIIQGALSGPPSLPPDAHYLLESLNEWLHALHEPLAPPLRQILQSVQVAGKTGVLVKRLLATVEETGRSTPEHVARLSLKGRVTRAREWQRRESSQALQRRTSF